MTVYRGNGRSVPNTSRDMSRWMEHREARRNELQQHRLAPASAGTHHPRPSAELSHLPAPRPAPGHDGDRLVPAADRRLPDRGDLDALEYRRRDRQVRHRLRVLAEGMGGHRRYRPGVRALPGGRGADAPPYIARGAQGGPG